MSFEYIVLHHSATADSGTVSWGAIRRYHVQEKGWYDIGYHGGVELVGDHYECLVGRPLLMPGAAGARELNMNQRGVHICCVGDYDSISPPEAMYQVLVRYWLRPLLKLTGVPIAHVIGHRDVGLMAGFDWQKGQYKSCPGRLFDLDRVRGMLA